MRARCNPRTWSLLSLLIGTCLVTSVSAQTIIINPPPRPPVPGPRPTIRDVSLEISQYTIHVNIIDGVATTNIDQTFKNTLSQQVEGTYLFPLGDDVALGDFAMFIDGKEIKGQLLDVNQARQTYESIVASMRDPALLEYIGTKLFKARIFPIAPGKEARIKLSYTQNLTMADGLVRYRYPLKSERLLSKPINDFTFSANIQSKKDIKSVFSPSHHLSITRAGDKKATVSMEAKTLTADRHLDLYYQLSDKEFGMTLMTYREPGQDGYFLMRLSPPASIAAQDVIAKDVTFVIDVSGSMDGKKIEQARDALKFCLSNLNSQDRFNIVKFSHEPQPFNSSLVQASKDNIKRARDYAGELKANGGTNINDALMTALQSAPEKHDDRPYMIVFLTDGEATVGVKDTQEILSHIKQQNDRRTRMFVFGVGYDVNTHLLDLLAEDNRGTSDYVEPDENLELKLSSFYKKVSNPVLADLSIDFSSLSTYDIYPPKLSDLFAGTELVIAGRYSGEGSKAVTLTGTRRGQKQTFVFESSFPSKAETYDFLPRLWATRKVGYLLQEIRLHGEKKELKESVVKLAKQYGIVTPYTAYLVTEKGELADNAWQLRVLQRDALAGGADASAGSHSLLPTSGRARGGRAVPAAAAAPRAPGKKGKAAVGASKDIQRLQMVGGAAMADDDEADTRKAGEKLIRTVGTRTFYNVDGKWVDAAYEKDMDTRKIVAFSKAYFALMKKHDNLGKYFALGERVIVVLDGVAYETVPEQEAETEDSK